MSRRMVVTAAVVAAACGSPSARPAPALSKLRSLVADAGCWPSDAQEEAIFAETVAAVRATLDRPARAKEDVERISRAIGASNMSLQAFPLGERGVALLVQLGCAGEPAAIELASFRFEGSGWERGATRRPRSPASFEIVAHSDRVPRIAVLELSMGTQAEHGTLEVLDDRLRAVERHDDLLDPVAVAHGGAAVVRWKERRRHLAAALDSPFLREVEAIVDVERTPAISVVSQEPWLDALDAICAVRDDVPCGRIAGVQVDAGRMIVDLEDTEPAMRCGVVPGAPTLGVAAVHAATITMVHGVAGWDIGAVRPLDRWCAVYGERIGPALRLAPGVEKVAALDRPRALAADGDGVLVATAEQIFWLGRRADQPIWVDEPRDVALISGVPTWVDAAGQIARAPGRRKAVVADAPGAGALGSCDGAICWSDYDAGTIYRLGHRGPAQVAAGLAQPLGFAVGPDALYVATDDGISTVRADTGAAETLTGARRPLHVAHRGGVLAWTEADGRVVARARDGSSTVLQEGGRPSSIAISDGFVYWIDLDASAIRRAPVP